MAPLSRSSKMLVFSGSLVLLVGAGWKTIPTARWIPAHSQSLAHFQLGPLSHIVQAVVREGSQRIPLVTQGQAVRPREPLPAGVPVQLSLEVQNPSWLRWVPWSTAWVTKTVETPPPAQLKRTSWTVPAGGSVRLQFAEPVVKAWVNGHTSQTVDGRQLFVQKAPWQQGARFLGAVSAVTVPWESKPRVTSFQWSTPPALTVATTPVNWQHNVSRQSLIVLNFSEPVTKSVWRHLPILQPAVPGHWTLSGRQLVFHPKTGFPPGTLTLSLAAGLHGVRTVQGSWLGAPLGRTWFIHTPYYITVSKKLPETLTLYKGSHTVLKSLVNTGIQGAKTPNGTFYVETKLLWVNMRGVDPNGTPYFAPHVKYVMPLVGNVAIHGYTRAHYGFPQSAGCIELPIPAAKKLYSLVPVGTPVTVGP